jgi:hypothetical protein
MLYDPCLNVPLAQYLKNPFLFNLLFKNTFTQCVLNKLKIFIKYMVSIRCKMVVKAELDILGLHYTMVDLGEAEIMENITPEQREQLKTGLLKSGLELMEDKRAMLIEN